MKNRLKISLLITKLFISQHIYVRYVIIRNVYKPQFKVKFNHKRFENVLKSLVFLYKTKLPFKMALSINFEFAIIRFQILACK
jgi:hypothetical protein